MARRKEDNERYRKIDPRIWNDEKFRAMSDRGKLVFLFILTHPSLTAVGAMRHTMGGLAEELEWNHKTFRDAFEESRSFGMLTFDPAASFISAPKFIRFNKPQSPNVVTSWRACMQLLPECKQLTEHLSGILDFLSSNMTEAYVDAFVKAFQQVLPEGIGKASGNQEQEQEQDHHDGMASPENGKAFPPPDPVTRAELAACGVTEPSLSRCAAVPGLTPVLAVLLCERARREATRNPPGWLVAHLTQNGFHPPETLPVADVVRLAKAGRVATVAGHELHPRDPKLGFNDSDPKTAFIEFTDAAGARRRVPATRLTPDAVTVSKGRPQPCN